MLKPILYPTTKRRADLTLLRKALDEVNFPYVVDFSKADELDEPIITYNNFSINGFRNLLLIPTLYADTPDLSQIFKMKKSNKKLTTNRRVTDLMIGFLLGGVWVTTIAGVLGNSYAILISVTIIPPILVLGFPYYWPKLKTELQRKD